ncbi:hypothetical protein [Spiroplasma endosymbiont of Apeira syringaria]|uniref:hypothetical protein n=1 Tax=Spiroplasma endosymbiont of Apeira syringaria TaxID=3066307 RepID=UPI0030D233B2
MWGEVRNIIQKNNKTKYCPPKKLCGRNFLNWIFCTSKIYSLPQKKYFLKSLT